jgi:hypothetical protein
VARTSRERERQAWQLQCEYIWWRVQQGLPVGVVPVGGLLLEWRGELKRLQRLGEWLGEG